jgi:hypothetical protein
MLLFKLSVTSGFRGSIKTTFLLDMTPSNLIREGIPKRYYLPTKLHGFTSSSTHKDILRTLVLH